MGMGSTSNRVKDDGVCPVYTAASRFSYIPTEIPPISSNQCHNHPLILLCHPTSNRKSAFPPNQTPHNMLASPFPLFSLSPIAPALFNAAGNS